LFECWKNNFIISPKFFKAFDAPHPKQKISHAEKLYIGRMNKKNSADI